MTSPYDDPHFEPPADIKGADARAHETKIVEMLRGHLLPSPGPRRFLQSIELRGQRPDAEIIFRYTDRDRPRTSPAESNRGKKSGRPAALLSTSNTLNSAADVGSTIFIAWMAGDLEPLPDK